MCREGGAEVSCVPDCCFARRGACRVFGAGYACAMVHLIWVPPHGECRADLAPPRQRMETFPVGWDHLSAALRRPAPASCSGGEQIRSICWLERESFGKSFTICYETVI